MNMKHALLLVPAILAAAVASALPGRAEPAAASAPAAVIDLMTRERVAQVRGAWRYSDTRIVETSHRGPGPDGQPTGDPNRTYDIEPRAGGPDFDDSRWEVIDPESLPRRRSTGRLCFNWYRIRLTIPERVGSFDPTGATLLFETVVDDYAEVWVDGELQRGVGQQGGSVVGGFNAPNRVVIGRGVRPGRQIQLAVFGINGPLSDPPANYIWIRRSRLEFVPGRLADPVALSPREVNVEVRRVEPALDRVVPPNPKLFKLAEGFTFTEGPIWIPGRGLLFSDPNENRIYELSRDGKLSIFRDRSGYSGSDAGEYGQPGANGLTLDPQGRLTIAEHGNHRISRLEKDGSLTVLADRYEGRRLNSPNDLVYRSNGVLYFTDPPFGLPKFFDAPRKELPFSGVYSLKNGRLRLETRELTGPNGIAFSPDEKFLYVGNWDTTRKVVMRYQVRPDGSLTSGTVFFDMTGAPGEEAIDGVKTDVEGHVYVSGPGGVWILSPEGKHLGTIRGPRLAANFAWGDDGRTLYLTARSGLYSMRLNVAGVRPR
jgi:gluconolactonase